MRSVFQPWLTLAVTTSMVTAGTGCHVILGIEDLPPLSGYGVGGTATGLLGPVSLELRYGNQFERLDLTDDGPFAFQTRLEAGTSYTVSLMDESMPCVLASDSGVIASADAAIELTCTGPALSHLELSGVAPVVVDLATDTFEYAVDLPLLQQSVTVTATAASPDDEIRLADTQLADGTPSAPVAVNLGETLVSIEVTNAVGWPRAYELRLRRAGDIAQFAYGKASNSGAEDRFGWSMSLSGDTLVVGAPYEDSAATSVNGNQNDDSAVDSGAVYVFRRTGSSWEQEAYIKAANADAGDRFGSSVAISGDILVVGAPGESSAALGVDGDADDDSAANSGAVYVFRRTGSSWQQETYVKALDTSADDAFGLQVSLSGDTLAVGAVGEDSAATGINGNAFDINARDSGAVYVFRRAGASWQQEAYVKSSNPDSEDYFGASVSLSGDLLAVGAVGEDSAAMGIGGDQLDDSASYGGAVYLFRRTGSSWRQEAYVKASNTDADDQFGTSVSVSGDTLAVGALYEDSAASGIDGNQSDNGTGSSGAAYVFQRAGGSWQQQAYVKASNTEPQDGFGAWVALSGDTLAIGAPFEGSAATGEGGEQADNGASSSGALYVFRRTGASWKQDAYVKASNTGPGDQFGVHVALSGDTLAVGAVLESSAATGIDGDQNDDGAFSSGAIYIFH